MPNPTDLAVVHSTTLVTSRYKTWRPEHGVAVQITVGAPKFGRWPDLVDGRIIAPYGLMDLPTDEPDACTGSGSTTEPTGSSPRWRRSPPSIPASGSCCSASRTCTPGRNSHRRWLADWLADRFRIEVPEATVVDQQPTLF